MPNYYATYAGMLQYLSREFKVMAKQEQDGSRFSAYAHVLDQMAMDRGMLEELEADPEAAARASSELLQQTWYNIGTNDPQTSQIPAPDSPIGGTGGGASGAEPVDAAITIEVP